jgi:hypothetical protein
MRMSHIFICGLFGAPVFSSYLKNDTIFEKKKITESKMYVFSLQLLSETFFILRRIKAASVV